MAVEQLTTPQAIGAIGAGLAIGISAIGSGVGQGMACSAAAGATAEEPGFFGKGIVFGVLPETQVIYGLVVAILILVGSGLLGG